jgi:hypothetical protein
MPSMVSDVSAMLVDTTILRPSGPPGSDGGGACSSHRQQRQHSQDSRHCNLVQTLQTLKPDPPCSWVACLTAEEGQAANWQLLGCEG